MRLAVMQPYLFPYIGYWQLMHEVDRFVILDDVSYIKRGWINRNRVLVNGNPHYITVPLTGASQNRRICDIEISLSALWKKKLFKTLENSYRKAPYFNEIYELIVGIIECKENNLSDYVVNSIMVLSGYLEIRTDVVPTSRIYDNTEHSGADRVLDICKRESADAYINAQGGRELYNQKNFSSAAIDLKFLVPNNIKYQQFGQGFVPWLSIIDVLMFNSKEKVRKMLCAYEVVR